MLNRRFAVAPMLDWTDRHCRYFLRCITRHALLYTEMVHVGAILHGQHAKVLGYHPDERPLALQLGGADPQQLAECARIAEDYGYDEVNLNCGCPSDRVRDGRFGACLFREPEWVGKCVAAMRSVTTLPITVKTRLGVDDYDHYEALCDFVRRVAASGCNTFIIHARKAWLTGLSPKQNREIPPLDYDRVYRLKRDFPTLTIVLNGGIESLDATAQHLLQVDGVMLGRSAYHNPYMLAEVDRRFFASTSLPPSRHQILQDMAHYIETQIAAGIAFKQLSRHMLGLFQGCAGARGWRRYLSEHSHLPNAGIQVLQTASSFVTDAAGQRTNNALNGNSGNKFHKGGLYQ